jgi:phage FluMu protein Com
MNVDSLITTRCTRCGDVDLLAEQMWLVVAEPRERTHFAFRCPDCEVVERHLVDDETLALLLLLLPVEEISLPAEALETHDGPDLTEDDLIDLMIGLDCVADNCTC